MAFPLYYLLGIKAFAPDYLKPAHIQKHLCQLSELVISRADLSGSRLGHLVTSQTEVKAYLVSRKLPSKFTTCYSFAFLHLKIFSSPI